MANVCETEPPRQRDTATVPSFCLHVNMDPLATPTREQQRNEADELR